MKGYCVTFYLNDGIIGIPVYAENKIKAIKKAKQELNGSIQTLKIQVSNFKEIVPLR
jgi:hypothetical protein